MLAELETRFKNGNQMVAKLEEEGSSVSHEVIKVNLSIKQHSIALSNQWSIERVPGFFQSMAIIALAEEHSKANKPQYVEGT